MYIVFTLWESMFRIIISLLPIKKWRKNLKCIYQRKRKQIWKEYYAQKPVHNQWVIFWDGVSINGYGDNIKPIYEEFKKRHPNFYYVFIVNNRKLKQSISFGDKVICKDDIKNFYKYLSCGKYYITNMYGIDIKRKKEQIRVDTGHGTPLKTIGFKDPQNTLMPDLKRQKIIQEEADFNIKIFPNDFTKDVVIQSYSYLNGKTEIKKETLWVTGYPRNDILFKYDPTVISTLKKNLGIPTQKKVILYTPTYRNGGDKTEITLMMDVKKMESELSEEYILLLRAHYFTKQFINEKGQEIKFNNNFSYNISYYPDIAEIYLITDILISDYSSTAVDFASLYRSQIFFCPDFDKYKKERGFNIDYEAEMPGPIVFDNEGLIKAINDVEKNKIKYAQKYQEFYDKYCTYEDGHAAERVVDCILEEKHNG